MCFYLKEIDELAETFEKTRPKKNEDKIPNENNIIDSVKG